MRFSLDSIESYIADHLKLFISMAIGLLVLVGIIALIVFFVAVRGAEQTMVPDIQGKELTEALIELQKKELYPQIQLRYSQTSRDKGFILEQDPRPGTIVKAGRRIRLVVSRGVIISKVENYIGRDLNEVRLEIQTAASGMAQAPISLKEPLMYKFSAQSAGTILEQKPEPGTDISGPMQIEFIVSKGQDNIAIKVPQLTGLSIPAALEALGKSRIRFAFNARSAGAGEKYESVVWQDPPANTSVNSDTLVNITITPPQKLKDNEVFKIFRYTMPPNPYPLALRLEALYRSGERVRIINTEHSGGDFSVPCKVPAGTVLILYLLNREIYRETVSAAVDPLLPEQL